MVFMFYAFAVSLMLLIRPWVAGKFVPMSGKLSIYAAMYFFPLLSLVHAAFGGLICKFLKETIILKHCILSVC